MGKNKDRSGDKQTKREKFSENRKEFRSPTSIAGLRLYVVCIVIVGIIYSTFSCGPGPFERGEEIEGKTDQETLNEEYKQVYEILNKNCIGCHKTGGPAGATGYVLTGDPVADYDIIVRFIDTEKPAESELLKKGSGETSHGGGKTLSTEDYETIKKWIENGAEK